MSLFKETNTRRCHTQYFEGRKHNYCQVHALNNAAGTQILDENDLQQWMQAHYASQPHLLEFAANQNGYFSDGVIQAWLMHNKGCTVKELYSTQANTYTESALCFALNELQREHGNIAFLGKTAEHAIAFRKAGTRWYLLDSQHSTAKQLNAHSNETIPYILQHFSVITADPGMHDIDTHAPETVQPVMGSHTNGEIPYWEKQNKQFCYAHALNAAIGHESPLGEEILAYCVTAHTKMKQHIDEISNSLPAAKAIKFDDMYTAGTGNFTTNTMNCWLYNNMVDGRYYHLKEHSWVETLNPRELDKCIDNTAIHKSAIVLQQWKGYWHAIAFVKKVAAWWMIDSENSVGPVKLTREQDWASVAKGAKIVTVLQGRHPEPKQLDWRLQFAALPCPLQAIRSRLMCTNPPTVVDLLTQQPGNTVPVTNSLKKQKTDSYHIQGDSKPHSANSSIKEVYNMLQPQEPSTDQPQDQEADASDNTGRPSATQHTNVSHNDGCANQALQEPSSNRKHEQQRAPKPAKLRLKWSESASSKPSKPKAKPGHKGTSRKCATQGSRAVLSNWLAQKDKANKASEDVMNCNDNVATTAPSHMDADYTKEAEPTTAHTSKPPCTDKPGDAHVAQSRLPGDSTNRKRPRPEAADVNEAPPASKPQGDQPLNNQQSHQSMKVATLNVRGLRTSKLVVEATLAEHQPDVIFLTEHKLKPQSTVNKGMLAAVGRMGYQSQLSCSRPADGEKWGRRGVAILVRGNYEISARLTPNNVDLNGCIAHVVIEGENTSPPLHAIGVYMPCEDLEVRKKAYDYIASVSAKCKQERTTLIVGGDWNAVMTELDRSSNSLNGTDSLHRQQCTDVGLYPYKCISNDNRRQHTFESPDGVTTSRIDDILLLGYDSKPDVNLVHEQIATVCNLDHSLLVTTVTGSAVPASITELGLQGEGRNPSTLVTPIQKEQLMNWRTQVDSLLTPGIKPLTDQLRSYWDIADQAMQGSKSIEALQAAKRALMGNGFNQDALAVQLQEHLQKALNLMLKLCETRQNNRSHKFHLPRKDTKRLSKAMKLLAARRWLQRNVRNLSPDTNITNLKHHLQDHQYAKHNSEQAVTELIQATPQDQGGLAEWKEQIEKQVKAASDQVDKVKAEIANERSQAAKKAFNQLFSKNRKQAHRRIFGTSVEHKTQSMLHPVTKAVHRSEAGVLGCFEAHLTNLMTPDAEPNRTMAEGRFDWPWQQTGAKDPFTLTTPAIQHVKHRTLLEDVLQRSLYEEAKNSLANGKQAGPDGIPNELIKHLPEEWHYTIHTLFTLLWVTGTTPAQWKESYTVMLHKKGNTQDPSNYRPVGLNQTIGKLWTKTITLVLTRHADTFHILSEAQEGCLRGRSTARQARNVVNAIEDAATNHQDLIIGYIDFSSAFTAVDHYMLIGTMRRLGFTDDACEVVRSVYHEAVTKVRSRTGNVSNAIYIKRGTIQGDSLSPFLFLVYIEPLLRWLTSGGRGYQFGCIKDAPDSPNSHPKLRYALPAGGFVDDIAVLTRTACDMQIQITKLEAWSRFAKIKVNAGKCAVTGVLHEQFAKGRNTGTTQPDDKRKLEGMLKNKIKLGNTFLPYLAPHEAYKYLGWYISMTMDWRYQFQSAIKTIKSYRQQLACSIASPEQRLQMIESKIRPAITYHFALAPYTIHEVEELDTALAQLVRHACRLPAGFARAGIQMGSAKGGIGVHSLQQDYIQAAVRNLTTVLNDNGRLGVTTKALFEQQRSRLADTPASRLHLGWNQSTTMRQLQVMQAAGITLSLDGEPVLTTCRNNTQAGVWQVMQQGIGPQDPDRPHWLPCSIGRQMSTLLDLNVTSAYQLIEPTGTHLIDTITLRNNFPQARCKHERALNGLTLTIHDTRHGNTANTAGVGPQQDQQHPRALHKQTRKLQTALAPLMTLDTKERNHVTQQQQRLCELLLNNRTLDVAVTEPRPTESGSTEPVQQQASNRQNGKKRTNRNRKLSHVQYVKKFNMNKRDTGPAGVIESPDELEIQEHGIQLYKGMPTPDDAQKVAFMLRQQAQTQRATKAVVNDYYWKATKILAACTEKISPPPGTQQSKHNLGTARYYLVEWMPTIMFSADLEEYLKTKGATEVSKQTPCPQAYDRDVVLVEWKDSWELASIINDQSNIANLVLEWHQRCQQVAPSPGNVSRRYDEGLTELQKQGSWADVGNPALEQAALKKQVQTSVSFFPDACNPDLDLTDAPMEWVIQIGKHHTGGPGPVCENFAFVYDPQGHWVGSITTDRLQFLQRRWHVVPETTREELSVVRGTDQQMFIANVAATLKLYDRSTEVSAQLVENGCNKEEEEDTVIAALLSSDMNVMLTNPLAAPLQSTGCMKSCEAQDQVFAFEVNPHATAWIGCTYVATHDEPEADKALRWALASAQAAPQGVPVCTILKLPSCKAGMLENAGLPSQYAHLIGTIQKTSQSIQKCIIIVANEIGLLNLDSRMQAALSDIEGFQPAKPIDSFNPPNSTGEMPFCTPRSLRKILGAGDAAWAVNNPMQQPVTTGVYNSNDQFRCTRTCGTRVLPNEMVAYTDGSCLPSKDGQPQRLGGAAICTYQATEKVIQVHPQGRGVTNTINRAELVSIHQALRSAMNEESTPQVLTIYTDSQCAMSLLRKHLTDGHMHYVTIHKALLDDMVQTIEKLVIAGCKVTLAKVKSHIGVAGNERADEVAVKTAQGKRVTEAIQVEEHADNATAFNGVVWPCMKATNKHGKEEHNPIVNLTTSVIRACQGTCELNHCGSYTSVYAKAWRATAPQIWNKAGSWIASRKLPWAAKRTAFKYRWGKLFTTKQAKLMNITYFGMTITSNAKGEALCPLCKQPDSGTHVLGGCTATPEMHALYVKRHDEAVQRIRQAISSGTCGRGTILMDAGKRSELPADVSGKATDLKEWLKVAPRAANEQDFDFLSKPDLTILPDVSKDTFKQLLSSGERLPLGQRIILVEVGYTADTRPDEKRAEKWEQHRILVDTLTRLGFKVQFVRDTHCVPLGHGGTVYTSLEALLQKLGVVACHRNKLMRHLEKHAIQYAHAIVAARRRLEAAIMQVKQASPGSMRQWETRPKKRKRENG